MSTHPSNSVNALAKLIRYGGQLLNGSTFTTLELLDLVSSVLINEQGPLTVLLQGQFGTRDDDHPLAWEATGFEDNYPDVHSQINHFWNYFNTTAQGGELVASIADWQHECNDPSGRIYDARLTTTAVRLGREAAKYSPDEIADKIESTIASPFDGYLLDHYYQNSSCACIALKDLALRNLPAPSNCGICNEVHYNQLPFCSPNVTS